MSDAQRCANNFIDTWDQMGPSARYVNLVYLFDCFRKEAFLEAATIARAQQCSCETCPEQISRKLRVKAGENEL